MSRQRVRIGDDHTVAFLDCELLGVATAFGGAFAAGVIDEDVLHGHGRGSQKCLPVGRRGVAEPEIHFVYQGRRVERVPGRFVSELGRREPAELVINQGEKPAVRTGSLISSPGSALESKHRAVSSSHLAISSHPRRYRRLRQLNQRSRASVSRIFAPRRDLRGPLLHPSYATFNRGSDSAYFFWPSRAAPTVDFVLNVVQASGSLASRIARASRRWARLPPGL